MPTVGELARWMEGFAPSRLAESWDNVGLLWGDPAAAADRVMTCLTVTPATAAEAIDERAGAIVSHHPILFRGTKSVRADSVEGGFLWRLARAGIAVLSPHTAFDNTAGGINDRLAGLVGLEEVGPIRPSPEEPTDKVVVFVPRDDREPVLAAAFAAGAGVIGDYSECSFSTRGVGTFFGGAGSNPTVGQAGRREVVREWKVELVCPRARLAGVLAAVRRTHSYEEPAIDVLPLRAEPAGPGVGRLGRLVRPEPLGEFATRVAERLAATGLQYVGEPDRPVERVAICCGAGDDFLGDAIRLGADCLLTGEARFHRALEADALGIGLVVAGHHATERPGVEDLAGRIAGAFPALITWASRAEVDPLHPAGPGRGG